MLVFENKYKIQNYAENMSDEELFEFCIMNESVNIERDSNQNIIIMPPTSGFSSIYENEVITEVSLWRRKSKSGYSLSSNGGYLLPNGAMRSPDASWISSERWATIPKEEKLKFIPVAPDFIIEIRSPSDRLKNLKEKMQEWIDNGVRLGWLIDPKHQQSYIYRKNGSIEIVEGFNKKLSGEDVMEGFEFDLNLLKIEE